MTDSPIDEHLAQFDDPQRAALQATCAAIRKALPGAAETISYGMPTFKIGGMAVLGLDGFKEHNSLFPYSSSVIETFRVQHPGYVAAKGTLHFPRGTPFPAALIKQVLDTRIAEINASYPKRSGEAKAFYANGRLKSAGRFKDAQMHGAWQFYRKDGTLMRSGSFDHGTRTGTWTTYDATGEPHKVTRF
ncbi:MAG: DUF1801 domain-containing protein [Candidatus Nanopelagicales bacterium]